MRFTRRGSLIGERVELAPHLDLWARGARFGVIAWQSTRHKPDELFTFKVRMDHPAVKRLAVVRVADIARMMGKETGQ